MKSCRECKALNPQDARTCLYCRESLPSVERFNSMQFPKFNLSSLMKRRLGYLALAILILFLAELVRR